ncbi:MAG: ATP-binding protein [Desulfobacterales bacterium]|nr:ATP-binding protein [Desulfobacterales bacterium]
MPKMNTPHFEVHPSVVYHLGESLITDSVQALIELVKNSYDADATYTKVTIDTKGSTEFDDTFYSPEGGRIIIEDDGFGMNLEDIEAGWLMISNRKKHEFKKARKLTDKGRTPLGDKGLGRLGVQRLGEKLEIFTKTKKDGGVHFGFSWSDFAKKERLQDVSIQLDEWKNAKQIGTRLVISNLQELELWRGEDATKKLQNELSQMISPFKQIRDYVAFIEIDGKPIELQEITEKVRDIAPLRYSIHFDGKTIEIKGRAKLNYFCPSERKEAEEFALIAEGDDGKGFYDFLSQQKYARSLNLKRSKSANWYVEFEQQKELEDVDGVYRVSGKSSSIANPGPFKGEMDSFDLSVTSFDRQNVFDRMNEFRNYIKKCSGIRVFRDGFGIRVDKDWLKLGDQYTSGPSFYGLKPNNTVGFIALSARENMDLEETTDREGFKDTVYYRNFYSLLMEVMKFTQTAGQFFGRSWIAYKKERKEELAKIDSRKTIEDISHTMSERLSASEEYQKKLDEFQTRLQTSKKQAQAASTRLSKKRRIDNKLRSEVSNSVSNLNQLIDESQEMISQVSVYLGEISTLRHMGQVLNDRIDGFRDQMDNMYEAVALGLTAEALSHEIFNIADQLSLRTKKAQSRARAIKLEDRILQNFIEHVKSSSMALRKQMSFLSPALRYVREQRDSIDTFSFMKEIREFYKDRLQKNNISILIHTRNGGVARLKMNRGKLTQIIDNFILNSEYWLREDISQGRMEHGSITIELDRYFVRIFDSGKGIDPNIEYVLFEPFVTAKGKGKGRGLGLFIIKQLIDSEGCNVGILPERNSHDRLFKFQIDFRGAIDE